MILYGGCCIIQSCKHKEAHSIPYEMTQARALLKRYMKEIRDMLTTDEDIQRYAQFNDRLKELSEATEKLYNESTPMGAAERSSLREKYSQALEGAAQVMTEGNPGPVGLRLRTVVRELSPLLSIDLHALELAEEDPTLRGENLSLPGNGRGVDPGAEREAYAAAGLPKAERPARSGAPRPGRRRGRPRPGEPLHPGARPGSGREDRPGSAEGPRRRRSDAEKACPE